MTQNNLTDEQLTILAKAEAQIILNQEYRAVKHRLNGLNKEFESTLNQDRKREIPEEAKVIAEEFASKTKVLHKHIKSLGE